MGWTWGRFRGMDMGTVPVSTHFYLELVDMVGHGDGSGVHSFLLNLPMQELLVSITNKIIIKIPGGETIG